MSLALSLETSYKPFSIAFQLDTNIIYIPRQSTGTNRRHEISTFISDGLKEIGKKITDIKKINVSIGPGGLTSIRSGVTFANALGYGLKIPVSPINTFALTGYELWRKFGKPVLCTSKAPDGEAYLGIFNNERLTYFNIGRLDDMVHESTYTLNEVIVAGPHRENVINRNPSQFKDSGILVGHAATFFDMQHYSGRKISQFPDLVQPINEKNIEKIIP